MLLARDHLPVAGTTRASREPPKPDLVHDHDAHLLFSTRDSTQKRRKPPRFETRAAFFGKMPEKFA